MNDVFHKLLDEFFMCYLDDISIYFKTIYWKIQRTFEICVRKTTIVTKNTTSASNFVLREILLQMKDDE